MKLQTKAPDRQISPTRPVERPRQASPASRAPSTSRPTTTSQTARPAMWRALRSKPPPASARPTIRAIGAINAAVCSNLARHELGCATTDPELGPTRFLAFVSACSAGIGLLSGACSGRRRSGVRVPRTPCPALTGKPHPDERTIRRTPSKPRRTAAAAPTPARLRARRIRRWIIGRRTPSERTARRRPRAAAAAAPARVAQARAPAAPAQAADAGRQPPPTMPASIRDRRRLLAAGPDPDRDRRAGRDLDRRGRDPAAAPARTAPAARVSPKAS